MRELTISGPKKVAISKQEEQITRLFSLLDELIGRIERIEKKLGIPFDELRGM